MKAEERLQTFHELSDVDRANFGAFLQDHRPHEFPAFQKSLLQIAAADFSVWYQPTADGRRTAIELRQRQR